MKLKTKSKRDYEDDGLLPLVHIIFLLLIFFMIVGVIEKIGVELEKYIDEF